MGEATYAGCTTSRAVVPGGGHAYRLGGRLMRLTYTVPRTTLNVRFIR